MRKSVQHGVLVKWLPRACRLVLICRQQVTGSEIEASRRLVCLSLLLILFKERPSAPLTLQRCAAHAACHWSTSVQVRPFFDFFEYECNCATDFDQRYRMDSSGNFLRYAAQQPSVDWPVLNQRQRALGFQGGFRDLRPKMFSKCLICSTRERHRRLLEAVPCSEGRSQSAASTFNRFLRILFSRTDQLHVLFYDVHKSGLSSASRPPACHLQPQHPAVSITLHLEEHGGIDERQEVGSHPAERVQTLRMALCSQ